MANIEYSRMILKRTNTPALVPTAATSTDLNLLGPDEIFEGELFYNIPDEILYCNSSGTIV
jgi:hypothetical protein